MEANSVEAEMLGYPHKPSIYANDADLSDTNTTLLTKQDYPGERAQLLDVEMGGQETAEV